VAERAMSRAAVSRAEAAEADAAAARAGRSDDQALIAHLKLQIEKLKHQLYGPRLERTARLLDQLELQLEELEATATEDEIAAEMAARKVAKAASAPLAPAFSRAPPARACRRAGSDQLPQLRRHLVEQAGRERHREAGIDPAAVEEPALGLDPLLSG
jgi:hypothetical protein